MSVSFSLFSGAGYQFFDNSGNILSGGNLYVYAAGTTTQINTYADSSGIVLNTNPIVLDSSGRVPNEIWVTAGVVSKFALYNSTGTLIATWDNIPSLSTALDGTGVNNGVVYFNSTGQLTSSANFTYNGSNANIAGGITIGTTAAITSNATVGGNLTVTGTISSTAGISSSTPATTQAYNDSSTKIATTAFVKKYAPSAKIQSITASVSSNNLTVLLDPTYLDFRSSPTTSGTVQSIDISSQLSLTVPNGITLGMSNGISARLVVLAVYNGTSVQLAITNNNGKNFNETNLINTSTSASTIDDIYSSSVLSSVPYRVVGFIDITCATAGVWTANPTYIQGAGGQALTALTLPGVNIEYWTTNGTWTVPAGVTKALVWVFGGAGAGYYNGLNSYKGGYGGYIAGYVTGLSGTVSITVGAGGTAAGSSSVGTAGGTTTFGSPALLTATGGAASSGAGTANGTGTLGAGVTRIRSLCGLEGAQSTPTTTQAPSTTDLTVFVQSGLTSGQGNTIWSLTTLEAPGTAFASSTQSLRNGMGGAVIIQY